MAEHSIRLAEEADAAAIARLHLASYRAAYRGLLPDDFLARLDLGERELRWRKSLRDAARTVFLAQEEGQGSPAAVVAFAEVGPCRDPDLPAATGELMALHVADRCWRQGIGGAVHEHAVHALVEQGFTTATLWVLLGNHRACAFYERAGWAPDRHERHRVLRGVDVVELRYLLRLGR